MRTSADRPIVRTGSAKNAHCCGFGIDMANHIREVDYYIGDEWSIFYRNVFSAWDICLKLSFELQLLVFENVLLHEAIE